VRIENIHSYEQTNFPLTIVSGPGDEIGIKASYDTHLFDNGTIQRVLGHLKRILEQFIDYSDGVLDQINLLTDEEEKTLLTDWVSDTITSTAQFPVGWQNKTIHQLFVEQVERTPDAVALILATNHDDSNNGVRAASSPQQMTYAELNRQVDWLASYLRALGVGPEVLVGLMAQRSFELIIGMLAILKAGGGYLPLDPDYPAERLRYMLEDARVNILLTQSWLVQEREKFIYGPDADRKVVLLDKLYGSAELQFEQEQAGINSPWVVDSADGGMTAIQPVAEATPDNLAYVIYTSGSTGLPKGVVVEHRSLVNIVLNFIDLVSLKPDDRVLQFFSLGFDPAAEEIYPALLTGAALVLPNSAREMLVPDLLGLCDEYCVTILQLPVAYWHVLIDEIVGQNLGVPDSIRVLLEGGESPSVEKLVSLIEKTKNDRNRLLINAYGPTEAAVAVTFYKLDTATVDLQMVSQMNRLPIGRNIANVQIYIVDRAFRPVPIGVAGEIVIGGICVSRGYLNKPEITAEKFIANPFDQSADPREFKPGNSRLYRTGDLGRYLPDGNIEFLGRVDEQVKLRGFRIELGEIESVLDRHPLVQAVAVTVREDDPGHRQIVAYVTSKVQKDQAEVAVELREHLRQNLPDFMIPSVFVLLDDMPLTPNGKIDKKALPAPQEIGARLPNVYVGPRSPVEAIIAGIWEQVLGVERVGVYDNFFELGGHSLLATQVVSRLRSAFQIEIPLRDMFESNTVAELAALVESAVHKDAGLHAPAIELIERDPATGLPIRSPQLSFAQQRLWFLDQLAPGNLFYNIPLAVEMSGYLDIQALEQTLNEIIRRHAVLRTNFRSQGGVPVQVIRAELQLRLEVVDLSRLNGNEGEDEFSTATRLALEEARTGFDLAYDPLIRARVLRLGEDRHIFLLTMHHIISDGWSMGVFINEIAQLYPAFSSGLPSPLPELKIQYFDFAEWQRSWLQGEQLDRQLDYWKNQLSGQPRMLDMPTDHPRPAVQSWRGATLTFDIDRQAADRLNKFSRQEGVTLFMTLLAAYQTLLFRYSNQDDISVGIAIANRNRAEIEPLIGFFVNTLVMRTKLDAELGFKDLVKRVREITLGAYAHQDLPFEMLVEALQPERDLSHTPLFQVAFALQNVTQVSDGGSELMRAVDSQENRLGFRVLDINSGSAKFDMTLTLAETDYGLQGAWEYNSDLFEEATIHRMIGHFKVLLQGAMDDPDLPITLLPLLNPAERQMILVDWNTSDLPTPIDRCAHQLFEIQAAQRPQVDALIFEGEKYSYEEVNRRAEALANYLYQLGVGSGSNTTSLVGIMVERSPEMIVGILAVLKAGGAYLPLDPMYPHDRLTYMLEDSAVSVLLTQQRLRGQVENLLEYVSTSPAIIELNFDNPTWEQFESSPDRLATMEKRPGPDDLAYVIYTSGSTGKPKGTMLRHKGLSNLAEWQRQTFGIQEGSRVLQFSPLSFDASVWEIFMALANGGTLVLGRQEVLASGDDLLDLLRRDEITTVTLPPSVLRILPEEQVTRRALPRLETVISAGEACTLDLVQKWAPGRHFYNAYGPTETTVCASMYRCSEDDLAAPPIGCPIANTWLYVLDQHLQPVPIGVPGELFVSGVSLAVGYLNQPELSAQKFIPNPFVGSPADYDHSRLYRTGDLVRYQVDGNIEYLGRVDQQVKVRGFRIELGEIESALGGHPNVQEAVVVVSGESGDLRLVAFVVPAPDAIEPGLDVSDLKMYLRQTLPEYMLPSVFVIQAELPLSPSGKVDRKALAALQAFERPEMKVEYAAPRNETEETLIHISQELLRLEKVGIHDNFFELGGHSLLATQFVSRVRDEFNVELPLRKLFELPTVASIAEYVEQEQASNAVKTAERARVEEMLQKISQLSAEDVAALLEQKKASQ
jgi:amino acid adenylation domain-containing protein